MSVNKKSCSEDFLTDRGDWNQRRCVSLGFKTKDHFLPRSLELKGLILRRYNRQIGIPHCLAIVSARWHRTFPAVPRLSHIGQTVSITITWDQKNNSWANTIETALVQVSFQISHFEVIRWFVAMPREAWLGNRERDLDNTFLTAPVNLGRDKFFICK